MKHFVISGFDKCYIKNITVIIIVIIINIIIIII